MSWCAWRYSERSLAVYMQEIPEASFRFGRRYSMEHELRDDWRWNRQPGLFGWRLYVGVRIFSGLEDEPFEYPYRQERLPLRHPKPWTVCPICGVKFIREYNGEQMCSSECQRAHKCTKKETKAMDNSKYDERPLSDDYPVHIGFWYVAGGKPVCSEVEGTVQDLKRHLQADEICNCDAVARRLPLA